MSSTPLTPFRCPFCLMPVGRSLPGATFPIFVSSHIFSSTCSSNVFFSLNTQTHNGCHVTTAKINLPAESSLYLIIEHASTHEGDGHEVAKCEDCSVNLRSKWSVTNEPLVFTMFQCDHQGCEYKSMLMESLLSHQKHVHTEERPFLCSHTGCSYRCKTKSNLMLHQKRVHLKIRTKLCHVCDNRFFAKADLRSHMMARHQTKDHDMTGCDNCVTHLKKNHKLSQARTESHKRRAGKERTDSTAVNMQNIGYHKMKAEDEEENTFAFREMEVKSETNDLNEDLIDMHMDMQLVSSL